MIPPDAKFSLGRLVATPGSLTALALAASDESPADFFRRHARGDWGAVSDEDRRLND